MININDRGKLKFTEKLSSNIEFCIDIWYNNIADILDIPSKSIQKIIITNSELPPDSADGKFSRMDLNLKVDDTLINVEIQVKADHDYRDRSLFYWAKLYTSELKSGEVYGQLKKAITINIINFNMFEGNDYHTEVIAAIKNSNEIFSDKFSMHFFELKKVNKRVNPNNRRELWMHFLNADNKEDLEMLRKTNIPIMEKAVNVIYDLSEDTKIREMARIREKALHDEASALYNAKNEGRTEGRIEERNEIIKIMRSKGMTEEEIQDLLSN